MADEQTTDNKTDDETEDRTQNPPDEAREGDGQDYIDRSSIDFDPDEGLLSGTAIDGTSDIPGPHEDREDEDEDGESSEPGKAESGEAESSEAPSNEADRPKPG